MDIYSIQTTPSLNLQEPIMKLKSALVGLLAMFAVCEASADSISTGVAGWLVNGNPVVIENPIASPYWINNFGDGKWVGTTATDGSLSSGANPGTYTFSLNLGPLGGIGTFDLQYAADNIVSWSISNGSLLGTTTCVGNPDLTDCFGSAAGAPRSLSGTFNVNSILTATVTNGKNSDPVNPMGLLVVGTANVPVPTSLALLALGGAALAASRKTV
jgi:hypothetical protein